MPLWALLLLLQSSCGACAELARKIASRSPDVLYANAVASKLALYLAPTLRRAYARRGFDTSSLHALHSLLRSFKRALATTLKHIILGRLGSLRCCRRALDVLIARNGILALIAHFAILVCSVVSMSSLLSLSAQCDRAVPLS